MTRVGRSAAESIAVTCGHRGTGQQCPVVPLVSGDSGGDLSHKISLPAGLLFDCELGQSNSVPVNGNKS